MFKAIAAILSALVIATGASAATILSVDDARRGTGSTSIGPAQSYKAVAQSFTAQQDFDNVTFGMNLSCFSCAGELLFMTGIPANDTPGFAVRERVDIAAGQDFNTILTGLSLAMGRTYSVILEITSGDGIWRASTNPIIGGTGGVTAASHYLRTEIINNNFTPWSPFETRDDATLQFTLSTPMTPVPLPASAVLLLGAMGVFGAFRAKRLHYV